jgi:hypothetical protein
MSCRRDDIAWEVHHIAGNPERLEALIKAARGRPLTERAIFDLLGEHLQKLRLNAASYATSRRSDDISWEVHRIAREIYASARRSALVATLLPSLGNFVARSGGIQPIVGVDIARHRQEPCARCAIIGLLP